MQQRVHQRSAIALVFGRARSRMHHHPRRLVHYCQIIIFKNNVEWNFFRHGTQRRTRGRRLDLDAFAATQAQGRLHRLLVHEDFFLRDHFLHARAADVGKLGDEEPVEARAGGWLHVSLRLPGRTILDDRIRVALSRAARNNHRIALVVVDVDTLLGWFPLEERVYRMRCVEAWSMVIPWIGFPLASLLKRVEPTGQAKYVEFTTLKDPEQFPAQKGGLFSFGGGLDWPYTEGLRLDEAMHPLALLTVGMYGKVLPNQNGAPIRVVNQIIASGDGAHGITTAAYNLPNDERVVQQKGSKRVMLKNVQQAKFRTVLIPIASRMIIERERADVSFEQFFTHILAHELMHGLGPHQITVNGQPSNPRLQLKELYGAIEEAKADATGLWALQYMMDHAKELNLTAVLRTGAAAERAERLAGILEHPAASG